MNKSRSILLCLLALSIICSVTCSGGIRPTFHVPRQLSDDTTTITVTTTASTYQPPSTCNTCRATSVTVASQSTTGFTFYPGQCIGRSDSVYVTLGKDCVLALYNNNALTWNSTVKGQATSTCEAVMQADGNLVVYDSSDHSGGHALWSSQSWTHPNKTRLQIGDGQLQLVQTFNDVNAVVVNVSNPYISSTTSTNCLSSTSISVMADAADDLVINTQNYIGDLNGVYAIFQNDCNFVLYDKTQALWSSNTPRAGFSCELRFERNGSLAIYSESNPNAIFWWTSGELNGNDKKLEKSELVVGQDDTSLTLVHTFCDGSTSEYDFYAPSDSSNEWEDEADPEEFQE